MLKEITKYYVKALMNDEQAIALFIPNHYVKDIYHIDYKKLKKLGIKNLLFDIDNTILPVNDVKVPKELKEFFEKLKKDFKICLLSNNHESRVKPVRLALGVLSVSDVSKPKREAFEKALHKISGTHEDTAMIGDQMITDILGGNQFGLYTVLVEPLKNKYDFKTGLSRVLQNILMKKLKNKIKQYHYF